MSGDEKKIKEIKELSKKIRLNIIKMALEAGSSSAHIGGAFSLADVVASLYHSFINFSKNPQDKNRDRFILSKGHACLVYYSILKEIGYLNTEDLKSFEKTGSILLGHPIKNLKKGIEFSTGSLGMGLSIANGIALSFKKKKLDNRIYVVMGDGELNEGSVWEALMSAAHFELDNLTIIIDKNGYQQTGTNDEILRMFDLEKKLNSFNLHTKAIDGHSIKEIYKTLEKFKDIKKPCVLIANTIKGKGFSQFEHDNAWHHKVLTKQTYDEALIEINNQ